MADGGEFDLIRRLAPFLADADGDVLVGAGDDAAVLAVGDRSVCLTVDVLVDEVHFRRDVSSLADVGWKAVAVNVSDVAAMGGWPRTAVVGLSRPDDLGEEDVAQLYEGMDEACRRWGLALVGGDTVRAEALAVSVTVLGEVDDGGVTRAGARPGDRLVLVGALGAASAALAALAARRSPDPAHLAAHRRPVALVAAGRALAAAGATALIDVSDGLGADLGHICRASGVGAVVDWPALPVAEGAVAAAVAAGADPVQTVCGGGEDFALLAAVPAPAAEEAARVAGAAEGVPAAVVGEVLDGGEGGSTARLRGPDGAVMDLTALGYDHFR